MRTISVDWIPGIAVYITRSPPPKPSFAISTYRLLLFRPLLPRYRLRNTFPD